LLFAVINLPLRATFRVVPRRVQIARWERQQSPPALRPTKDTLSSQSGALGVATRSAVGRLREADGQNIE